MKRSLLHIWSLLDHFYYPCTRLQCLERLTGQPNIFRVRLTRYKGREVILSDGTVIRRNDILVKIHFHNVRLLKEMQGIDKSTKRTFYLYKKVYDSMPGLVLFLVHHEKKEQIKGVIGITMISKGYHRLGFESYSLESKTYKLFKKVSLYPIFLLSTSDKQKKEIPMPHYLFMSTEQLYNQYGPVQQHSI